MVRITYNKETSLYNVDFLDNKSALSLLIYNQLNFATVTLSQCREKFKFSRNKYRKDITGRAMPLQQSITKRLRLFQQRFC